MLEAILKSGEPDAERRSCTDCRSNRAAVSWWCTDEKAREQNGTGIPGFHGCPFWKPVRKYDELSRMDRWFGDFIYIDGEPKSNTEPQDSA